jgi:hypothetical protein
MEYSGKRLRRKSFLVGSGAVVGPDREGQSVENHPLFCGERGLT